MWKNAAGKQFAISSQQAEGRIDEKELFMCGTPRVMIAKIELNYLPK